MTATVSHEKLLVGNALCHYYPRLRQLAQQLTVSRPPARVFTPEFELPQLDPQVVDFLQASEVGIAKLTAYRGVPITVLDLMRNPATRTTKTMASLLMVARAVRHIRQTGEPIRLLTPSSANKATALRDAVLRAVECGLVTPDQLTIATVVPTASRPKLWSSRLSTDPELRLRNPVLTFAGRDRSGVKQIAIQMVEEHGEDYYRSTGGRLWYTLDLDNYRLADAARSWIEADHLPATGPGHTHRMHVHAVSSAYGLLGHQLGREHANAATPVPQYFLVQHLDTPDMVLSLCFGSTDRRNLPDYWWDEAEGLFRQSQDPRFPLTTLDPDELIDPTFYTHNPPTSAFMNELIASNGGGGIVVSLHECLSRYGQVRALLAAGGIRLPADPRQLREWSLTMAATGLLEAIDRGFIGDTDVLLHASGSYATSDYQPLPEAAIHPVTTSEDVRDVVFAAAAG
jgi:hypothetical protein